MRVGSAGDSSFSFSKLASLRVSSRLEISKCDGPVPSRPYAPAMETALVQCPTCFETFEVVMPPPGELPAEMDYDCEVCCRPLILVFDESGAYARGLGE